MNVVIGTVLLWAVALWMLRRLRHAAPEQIDIVKERSKETMVFMMPRIFVGLVGAGFMAELMPVDQIDRYFGTASGLGGVALATAMGAVTPGGPFVAFAIGAAALKAGAGWAALMAYVTAWSVLNLNRSLAYEMPLMGRRFLLIRSVASLPLPLVLGILMLLW